MFKKTSLILLAAAMVVPLVGCSGTKQAEKAGGDGSGKPPVVESPAEFVILSPVSTNAADFDKTYAQPLSKKFPNTKFTQIQLKAGDAKKAIGELLTAGTSFDMIEYGITNMNDLIGLDLPMNLDPLVKKFSFDLNRFDPNMLKDIRNYSSQSELLSLPYQYQPFVLNYNKNIFDKFGVPYPKEGSSWDDLIELAKRVSRTEDGVSYLGLDAGLGINRMQTQLSLPYVDPKTGKSLVGSTPGWKKMFDTYLAIYGIPGNLPPSGKLGNSTKEFTSDQNLAMYPHIISLANDVFTTAIQKGLRMGITTFPVFKDAPDVSTGFFGQGLLIPKNSRYPDFAFEVMQYLTSDDVQIEIGKMGLATPLVNPKVQQALFEGNPLVQQIGFDPKIVYKLKTAPSFTRTPWDGQAQGIVTGILTNVISQKEDVDSALRDADDQINKMVQDSPK